MQRAEVQRAEEKSGQRRGPRFLSGQLGAPRLHVPVALAARSLPSANLRPPAAARRRRCRGLPGVAGHAERKREEAAQAREEDEADARPTRPHQRPARALRVVQWNAQGLRRNLAELRRLALAQDPDVILVQETWLSPDEEPTFLTQPPGGLPGVAKKALLLVLKTFYGFNEAPEKWRQRLQSSSSPSSSQAPLYKIAI